MKDYRRKNTDKISADKKDYYQKTRMEKLAYVKEYRQNNKAKIVSKQRNIKAKVFQILGNKCVYKNEFCSGPLELNINNH